MPEVVPGNGHVRGEPSAQPHKRITIYVPTTFNNGDAVPEEMLEVIQDLVRQQFGGYTLHLNVSGEWVNGQIEPIRDGIRKIEIEVDEGTNARTIVIDIADFVREYLGQEQIFVTEENVFVLIVPERDTEHVTA